MSDILDEMLKDKASPPKKPYGGSNENENDIVFDGGSLTFGKVKKVAKNVAKKAGKKAKKVAKKAVEVVGDVGDDIGTAGAHFANSAFLGLPKLVPVAKKYLEESEERNPIVANTAKYSGYLPGGTANALKFLGIGAAKALGKNPALVKKGGDFIAKGLKKFAPTEIASRIAQKGGEKAAKGVGRVLGAGKSPLGQTLAKGGGGVVKGGVAGALEVFPYSVIETYTNPDKNMSDVLTDTFTGAGLGVGLRGAGSAFQSIGKVGRYGGNKVTREAGEYFAEVFTGTRGLKTGEIKSVADHFNPVIETFQRKGYIKQKDLDVLIENFVPENLKGGIKNLTQLWNHLKSKPKAQMQVLTRIFAQKYPGAKNLDDIYEILYKEKKVIGEKMGVIENEVAKLPKGGVHKIDESKVLNLVDKELYQRNYEKIIDPTKTKAKKTIFDGFYSLVEDNITRGAGTPKTIGIEPAKYKEWVININQYTNSIHPKDLSKANNELIIRLNLINQNLSRDIKFIDPRQIQEQFKIFQKPKWKSDINQKDKEIFDNITQSFQSLAEQYTTKAKPGPILGQGINPVEFKKFVRSLKEKYHPYSDLGKQNPIIIKELNKVITQLDKMANKRISSVDPKYGELIKDYSEATRMFDLAGGQKPKTFLSYFQSKGIGAPVTKGLPFLSDTLAAGASFGSRKGTGYPQGAKNLQDSRANMLRKQSGQEIPYGDRNIISKLNPLSLLSDIIDKGRVVPRFTSQYIGTKVPEADITDGNGESKENENDAILNEMIGDQGSLKSIKNNRKKKVPEGARAGFDVEMILAEERILKVVNRITPPEIKEAKASRKPVNVPPWKMRRFEDRCSAALNPEYLIQKIAQGNLTAENVQDFKEVNPYLYDRIALQLHTSYHTDTLNLKYSQKIALGVFLGQDLTGLTGGVFNVNKESAEPITSIEREVHQKGQYVKGRIKQANAEEQKSASSRYSTI